MDKKNRENSSKSRNNDRIKQWFEKKDWLQGWNVHPHSSVNYRLMADQYFKKPDRWNAAFKMLKMCKSNVLEPGRHVIDGDNLFFMVNQYETRDQEAVMFEIHRKYIDIQYVLEGEELMGVAPFENATEIIPYSQGKDIAFVNVSNAMHYLASPAEFFIFFPEEPHQPGVKAGISRPVKKIVIKVKME
jgi:biofilm protein TabA